MKLDFYQTQERKPISTIYFCLLFCSSESRFSSLISFFSFCMKIILLGSPIFAFRIFVIIFTSMCLVMDLLEFLSVSLIYYFVFLAQVRVLAVSWFYLLLSPFVIPIAWILDIFLYSYICSTLLLFYCLGISLTESFLLFYFPVYWLPPPIF